MELTCKCAIKQGRQQCIIYIVLLFCMYEIQNVNIDKMLKQNKFNDIL